LGGGTWQKYDRQLVIDEGNEEDEGDGGGSAGGDGGDYGDDGAPIGMYRQPESSDSDGDGDDDGDGDARDGDGERGSAVSHLYYNAAGVGVPPARGYPPPSARRSTTNDDVDTDTSGGGAVTTTASAVDTARPYSPSEWDDTPVAAAGRLGVDTSSYRGSSPATRSPRASPRATASAPVPPVSMPAYTSSSPYHRHPSPATSVLSPVPEVPPPHDRASVASAASSGRRLSDLARTASFALAGVPSHAAGAGVSGSTGVGGGGTSRRSSGDSIASEVGGGGTLRPTASRSQIIMIGGRLMGAGQHAGDPPAPEGTSMPDPRVAAPSPVLPVTAPPPTSASPASHPSSTPPSTTTRLARVDSKATAASMLLGYVSPMPTAVPGLGLVGRTPAATRAAMGGAGVPASSRTDVGLSPAALHSLLRAPSMTTGSGSGLRSVPSRHTNTAAAAAVPPRAGIREEEEVPEDDDAALEAGPTTLQLRSRASFVAPSAFGRTPSAAPNPGDWRAALHASVGGGGDRGTGIGAAKSPALPRTATAVARDLEAMAVGRGRGAAGSGTGAGGHR